MKVSQLKAGFSDISSLLVVIRCDLQYFKILKICPLLIAYLLLFSSCGIFQPSFKPNDLSIDAKECVFGLKLFNEGFSQNVAMNIAIVLRSGNQARINELKALYPEFRDVWNSMVRDISKNYTSNYRVSGFPTLSIDELINPRSASIPAASKFHLLLFVFNKGSYPSGSNDLEKLAAYKEQADIGVFVNTKLRVQLQENCRIVSAEKVRAALQPIQLPETMEECLKTK